MLTNDQVLWTQNFIGRPDLAAPASPAAANGASQTYPRPMKHDCKVVHGHVPGPKNFVLCATHGHILDTDKKQIVAANLNEFNKAHPEFGKLPAPMLPDCAIVHGKVPGPKHHVLCGTHGHVLDEEKKQIIAHTLAEYIRHHTPPKQPTQPAGHGPLQASGPGDKEPGQKSTNIEFGADEVEPVVGNPSARSGPAGQGAGQKTTHVDFNEDEVEPVEGKPAPHSGPADQETGQQTTHIDFNDDEADPIVGKPLTHGAPRHHGTDSKHSGTDTKKPQRPPKQPELLLRNPEWSLE